MFYYEVFENFLFIFKVAMVAELKVRAGMRIFKKSLIKIEITIQLFSGFLNRVVLSWARFHEFSRKRLNTYLWTILHITAINLNYNVSELRTLFTNQPFEKLTLLIFIIDLTLMNRIFLKFTDNFWSILNQKYFDGTSFLNRCNIDFCQTLSRIFRSYTLIKVDPSLRLTIEVKTKSVTP